MKKIFIQSIVNNDNNLDDNKLKQLAVCVYQTTINIKVKNNYLLM